MFASLARFATLLSLAMLAASCSSTVFTSWPQDSFGARDALDHGEFDWAAEEYQNLHGTLESNEMLALIEEGMAWHLAGAPELACEAWIEAEQALDGFADRPTISGRSLTEGALSMAVNDATLPYDGEGFEVALLHGFMAYDYLRQGNLDDAMVEVKRGYAIQRREEERYEPEYGMSHFARFIASIAQGKDGRWDEAEMDLKQLAAALPDNQAIKHFLEYTRKMQTSEAVDADEEVEVYLIFERGRMPEKQEETVRYQLDSGFGTFSMPLLSEPPKGGPRKVGLIVDGKGRARTFLLQEIMLLGQRNLEDRLDWMIVKGLARSVMKSVLIETTAGAVAEEHGEAAGILAGLATSFLLGETERADCRSWTSLPQEIQIARVVVKPGKHHFAVRDKKGNELNLGSYSCEPGEPVLLGVRSLGSKLYSLTPTSSAPIQAQL